ncbi:MAG: zinc ribbon domain-containing protein [Planctomycetota bacterium]
MSLADDALPADLLESIPDAAPVQSMGNPCPSCGHAVPADAVICVSCGHSMASGKAVKTKVGKAKRSKDDADEDNQTASRFPEALAPLSALGGAAVLGMIGAAIWAFLIVQFDLEKGIVAIAIGWLCGIGAQIGARDFQSPFTGLAAVVVAIVMIFTGKVIGVSFLLNDYIEQVQAEYAAMSPEDRQAEIHMWIADEIAVERIYDSPNEEPELEYLVESGQWPDDYPDDLQREAIQRWESMSAHEQEQFEADVFDLPNAGQRAYGIGYVVASALGPIDAIFFLFAVIWAYRVGSSDNLA